MSTPDTQMNQYLTTIAEAVHGRDMRAAIHDGLEKTYNDSYTWFNQSLGNANQALQKATEALEIAEPMGDDIQEVKDLAEDLDTKYDETNERVNNIIAHNQDTQGNSELIDVRTTYDGQVKTSAGSAVRSQISNLNSRINNLVREQSTGELEDCHAKPVYVPLYENQYPSSAFAAQTLQLSLPGSPAPSLAKYAFIKITFKDSNLFGAGVRSVYIPNPGKDAEATNIYTSDGSITMPADGTYGISSYSRKFTAALSSNDTVLNIMFTNCEKIATDNPFAINNSDMTISDPSSTATTDNEYLIPYEVFLVDYVLDGEIEVDKDTELIDVRNADDGTTYQSAGAAVRGQVVSAKNKTASTQSMIAPLYSVTGTYAAGDYVNYADKLYKAKQAISSEAWTPSHWQEVNVMDEVDSDVGELKSALNQMSFENVYVHDWTMNKGIMDNGEIYSTNYMALSEPIKLSTNILYRNRNFVDGNNVTLSLFVAEYDSDDIFIKRTAITSSINKIILDDDCDHVRFSFGRAMSSGVTMSWDDLETYFDILSLMPLSDDIIEIKEKLYHPISDNYICRNGYACRARNGSNYNSENFSVTNDIDVSNYSAIIYSRMKVATSTQPDHGIAFYTSDGTYISGVSSDYNSDTSTSYLYKVSVPSNTKFVRATWWNFTNTAIRGDFQIFDAEKYEKSVSVHLDNLEDRVEVLEQEIDSTEIIHVKNCTQGQINLVRRCRQFTDIKWTPAFNIPRRSQMSGDVVGDTSLVYEDVFLANREYTGIPYARATRHASNWGYEDMKVGWTVGLDTFISAVMNSESVVAKDSVYDGSAHNACFYAIVCAALVSYGLDLNQYYSTAQLPNISGMNRVGKLNSIDLKSIRIGDMLNDPSAHCALVTDIVSDENGDVLCIEISEATTIGNDDWNVLGSDLGGVCIRRMWSMSALITKWGGYGVYRYNDIDNITYTKSPYVDTGNEGDEIRVVNFPVIPYMGENFTYKVGKIPNSTLLTHAYKAGQLTKLRVIKDGQPWNSDGTSNYYDVSDDVTEVGFADIGTYSAYMCEVEDGNEVIKTRSCHWKVIANS